MPSSPVQIDGWVTVEFICAIGGNTVETVFTYKSSTSGISQGDLYTFAVLWRDTMKPLLQAALSTGVTLVNVRAKTHFKNFPNVEAEAPFPNATYGTIAFVVSPGNVALATKLLTGIAGRKNRGRQYWFGIPAASIIGDVVTSGFLNALAQIFTRHLLGWTASGVVYRPAIASRVGVYLREVIEFAIEAIIDSQRRRLTGRGS